jgi:hypothetical protein
MLTLVLSDVNVMSGMSIEAGNRQKSPVTLAVTAGYFFSLKKITRTSDNSFINNITFTGSRSNRPQTKSAQSQIGPKSNRP